MRLAISGVYLEPKSRTSILSAWMSFILPLASHLSFEMIIRGLLRDNHIVDMAFPVPRRGNPDESCLLLEFFNIAASAVAHPRPESPYQLIDHGRQGPFVRNPPLDPLRHELLVALLPFLEITVPATALHRP